MSNADTESAKVGKTSTDRYGYILISPARNEEAFIRQTIESVVAQTVLPVKWVIVSDGSTDGTDDIVQEYATKYRWIELVRMPERAERHFAGKIHAFNAGYAKVRDLDYDVIGSLDADISFDEDYMGFLLSKLSQNHRLGVCGTPFREDSQQYDYRFSSIEHVSGACQLFRRQCFEEIGGYLPLREGGVDLAAVLTARLKGWETRTFTEKSCKHNKMTQVRRYTNLMATYRSGYHDYLMGNDVVWQILRSLYQLTKRPFVIGGSVLLVGYLRAMAERASWIIPGELVAFRRKEQMHRLRQFFTNLFHRKPVGHP